MISLCNSLPDDFVARKDALKAKYFPIEMNTNLPVEEKTEHMIEWYAASERLFNGVPLPMRELERAVGSALPELRDQSVELFR